MKTAAMAPTKQQILDVAEAHFALYGYAGTSLRGIIKEARVNVAAIAYHFGGKEELFDAVIERFAEPVVAAQLKQLQAVKKKKELKSVLEAFYLPPLKHISAKGRAAKSLALFLGRMQTEPEPIFSLVDKHFAPCRQQFVDAFQLCLPAAAEADRQWHFEFMLSLIVCFLTRQAEIRQRYADPGDWSPEEAAGRMIDFCLKGMLPTGRK